MRRPLAFTLVPLLALAGALAWSQASIAAATSRGDPVLYARAVEWERTLSGAVTASPLAFLHPSVRSHPGLRAWLAPAAQEFGDATVTQILEARVLDGANGVSTYMLQTTGFTRQVATIQFQWAKGDDGVWYVLKRNL